MSDSSRPAVEVRRLTSDDDWNGVLSLAVRLIPEIPLYRWVLGDELAADEPIRRLFAELTFTPYRQRGLHGAVDVDGRVIGVCVWSTQDQKTTPYSDAQRAAGQEFLAAHPEVLERLQINIAASTAASVPERRVELVLAAMDPTIRGQDLLGPLMTPMFRAAVTDDLPIITRTSVPALAESHAARWDGVERDSYTMPDGGPTIWVLESPAGTDRTRFAG